MESTSTSDNLNLLCLRNNYFIQMFFPGGYTSRPIAVCEQIILSSDDVVLNMAAEKLAGNSDGIMVLFGLGKVMSFKYEKRKLIKMK